MKFVGRNIQSKSHDQFLSLCPKRNGDASTFWNTVMIAFFPCSAALAFTDLFRLSVMDVTLGSFPSNIELKVSIRDVYSILSSSLFDEPVSSPWGTTGGIYSSFSFTFSFTLSFTLGSTLVSVWFLFGSTLVSVWFLSCLHLPPFFPFSNR